VTKFGLGPIRQNFNRDRLDWIRPRPILPTMTKFWLELTWPNMATFGPGPDQSNFGQGWFH